MLAEGSLANELRIEDTPGAALAAESSATARRADDKAGKTAPVAAAPVSARVEAAPPAGLLDVKPEMKDVMKLMGAKFEAAEFAAAPPVAATDAALPDNASVWLAAHVGRKLTSCSGHEIAKCASC